MKMVLNRVDGDYGMEVFSESGQCVSFDAAEKIGGKDFGIRPMEGVLSSLAACSSIDVLLILKKQKKKCLMEKQLPMVTSWYHCYLFYRLKHQK